MTTYRRRAAEVKHRGASSGRHTQQYLSTVTSTIIQLVSVCNIRISSHLISPLPAVYKEGKLSGLFCAVLCATIVRSVIQCLHEAIVAAIGRAIDRRDDRLV